MKFPLDPENGGHQLAGSEGKPPLEGGIVKQLIMSYCEPLLPPLTPTGLSTPFRLPYPFPIFLSLSGLPTTFCATHPYELPHPTFTPTILLPYQEYGTSPLAL